MFSPPLRAMLWKSIALALALIVVVGIVLDRLIVWLIGAGSASVETTLGPHAPWPVDRAGLAALGRRRPRHHRRQRMLMPAVTAVVASFFADRSPTKSSASIIRPIRPARRCRYGSHLRRAPRRRCLRSSIYLFAAPLLLFAGFGAVIFFLATAWILGREYFELAAMRFRPPARGARRCASATRRRFISAACSSPPSSRSRWSTWRRRCSPWPDGAPAQAARRQDSDCQFWTPK